MKELLAGKLLQALSMAGDRTLAEGLRRALGGRSVALCFHRVGKQRRAGELRPKLTMPPGEIDQLIQVVLACAGRVMVSFDDGYRDSADYILSRAARFPRVDWLFFLCPEKTEQRVGFRWDLAETRGGMF